MPPEFAYCKPTVKRIVCENGNDRQFANLQTQQMAKGRKKAEKAENHLAAWRNFRHLTQQQLASKVKTDKSVICLLESGDRGLSDKWLRRLAPVLGTSPGFLMDYDPDELPTDILDLWAEIPEANRSQARAVLETFRKKAS